MTKFCFVSDDDGHNYLIQLEDRDDFFYLLGLEDWSEFGNKFDQYKIDSISNWTFENPKEDD